MTDLSLYVAAWRQSADAVLALEPADWDVPTDLPGWTAKDVLAHLVHLKRVMVEGETDVIGGGSVPADYTNAGVAALRDVPVEQLRADLADLVARRAKTLEELPDPEEAEPDDLADPAQLRVRLTPVQVLAFAAQVEALVASSRPLCRLCERPIDPSGHACPRLN